MSFATLMKYYLTTLIFAIISFVIIFPENPTEVGILQRVLFFMLMTFFYPIVKDAYSNSEKKEKESLNKEDK